jgi:hypothetical protein
MADDERSTSSLVPGLVQEFIAQLRTINEGFEDLTGLGARRAALAGALPLPGALSAAQLTSIADTVASQRRSIEALQAQLKVFDEQLAMTERILGPLAEWSKTWADLEDRLLTLGGGPGTKSHKP